MVEARSVHSAVADGDTVYIWSGNQGGTEIFALKVYGTYNTISIFYLMNGSQFRQCLGTDLSLKNIVAKYIARNMPNENVKSLPQELLELIRGWRI